MAENPDGLSRNASCDDPRSLFDQRPHPFGVSDRLHLLNAENISNVIYWQIFFSHVEARHFDSIVECGVGRGRSLVTLVALNRLWRDVFGVANRRVIGFDSFQGFPEPSEHDISPRNPKRGEWSESPNEKIPYTTEFIEKVLIDAHLATELDNLVMVPGFFEHTCESYDTGSIGILHLDGDLYESTRAPLAAFAERIVTGGIIVIDDFVLNDQYPSSESWPGCRLAVKEFLQSNSSFKIQKSIRGTPYLERI